MGSLGTAKPLAIALAAMGEAKEGAELAEAGDGETRLQAKSPVVGITMLLEGHARGIKGRLGNNIDRCVALLAMLLSPTVAPTVSVLLASGDGSQATALDGLDGPREDPERGRFCCWKPELEPGLDPLPLTRKTTSDPPCFESQSPAGGDQSVSRLAADGTGVVDIDMSGSGPHSLPNALSTRTRYALRDA